jgi:hypothetical protein
MDVFRNFSISNKSSAMIVFRLVLHVVVPGNVVAGDDVKDWPSSISLIYHRENIY